MRKGKILGAMVLRVISLFLLVMLPLLRCAERDAAKRDFFDNALVQLMYHKRSFMDGFGNASAVMDRSEDFGNAKKSIETTGEFDACCF